MSTPNPLHNPYVETRLLRELCRNSFYQFCREFIHLVVPNTIIWNWHHEYLCQKFQDIAVDVLEGRPKIGDLIVSISPGTLKSSLLSVLLPVWLHTVNPSFRFITASFDIKVSHTFARQSKMIMDSPLYQKLFYTFKYSPERQGEYVNQYGGTRLAFSTGQSPTGRHANMIIIDDPIDPQLASNESKIRDINFWMNAVIRPRVADVLSTPLILVMQRLHHQDPVGDWLEHAKTKPGAKVFHISLPAEIDREHKPVPSGLVRYYQDGLLDPNRLGRAALEDRKAWMTNADYEAQYLQNPLKTEGLMFKVANINVRHLDPLDPIVQIIRYWDKAISVSDTACYTAGVKLGKTRSGRWWVLDVRRGKWGLYDRENMIRNTAESDGMSCLIAVESEPGSGGKESSMNTIRNLAGFTAYTDPATTAKEVRAQPLAIQVEQGNVYCVPAPWNDAFLSELASFPQGKFKDQVDAFVGGFNFLCRQQQRVACAF